jgi:hypothetical protein
MRFHRVVGVRTPDFPNRMIRSKQRRKGSAFFLAVHRDMHIVLIDMDMDGVGPAANLTVLFELLFASRREIYEDLIQLQTPCAPEYFFHCCAL